jgi:hypothetical protein
LYQTTNLALLAEDVINGMMAAKEFHGSVDTYLSTGNNFIIQNTESAPQRHNRSLEIILDIESKSLGLCDYNVQAGERKYSGLATPS